MNSLQSELIAYIGNKIDDPKQRANCYLASKKFSSTHFMRIGHDIKFNNSNNYIEKLANMFNIIKFVKKIKPRLEILHLTFENCIDFHNFDHDQNDLFGVEFTIDLKLCTYNFVKNCLLFLKQHEFNIKFIFIAFSEMTTIADVGDYNFMITPAKTIELYLHVNQFPMLNKPECLKNVISLTINATTHSIPTINLSNVSHVDKIILLTSGLGFNITCLENITHMISFSSVGYLFNCKYMTRLQTFTVMQIPLESVVDQNCSLFQLIENYVPRTAMVQLYAEDSPHMIHVCKHLSSKKINFELIYWNEQSFINCKLVQHFIPETKFVKFNSVFFQRYSSFTLSDTLKNTNDIKDFFQHMNQTQRLKWWLFENCT